MDPDARRNAIREVSARRLSTTDAPGAARDETVSVVLEAPVTIDVEGVESYTLLCTPDDNVALATGFLLSEGIIDGLDDVASLEPCRDDPDTVRVRLRDRVPRIHDADRNLLIVSSCGLCGAAGLEEKLFPHAMSAGSDDDLEEERRLCYVAMTRAMENLWISCAGERRRYGTLSFQSPSRFLDEIPPAVVQSVPVPGRERPRSAPSRSAAGRDYDYSYAQEPSGDDGAGGVRAGLRVRHPVFGVGTVLSVAGADLNQKLKIRFDRVGVKTVMLRYANLELA